MDYFASLFHGRLERDPSYIWSELVCCCTDLGPGEVYREIKQAYEEGLVGTMVIRLEEVEEAVRLGNGQALARLAKNPHYQVIHDAIKEMEWWACFQPKEGRTKKRTQPQPGLQGPPRLAPPKVGRNDPCPCGSGKKYKKCCGA